MKSHSGSAQQVVEMSLEAIDEKDEFLPRLTDYKVSKENWNGK